MPGSRHNPVEAVTETAHSALAHQFDSLGQQTDAGSLGMWVFLATEVLFFGGLFTTYTIYRVFYSAGFSAASHELDIMLGGINTAVLIASSLTMALAVHAAQLGERRRLLTMLVLTMALGSVFLGIKGVEYAHKFTEHHVPGLSFHFDTEHVSSAWLEADRNLARHAQIFFSLYFIMTGLHAIHMIIGIGVLIVMWFLSWRGTITAEYSGPIEISGLYW